MTIKLILLAFGQPKLNSLQLNALIPNDGILVCAELLQNLNKQVKSKYKLLWILTYEDSKQNKLAIHK